jgi:hypothetical protein
MAQSTRQTNLLVQQDWTKIYQTFTNADFTSYDFETLRNSMINYIKANYPETYNDFIESSEYIALIDMIAFLGQSLSFRTDLNARENFIDTAQRRDSILKLARMLSYNPHRTTAGSGLIKVDSVRTTENLMDSNGIDLSNTVIHWNDLTNDNWLEQFTTILNASLISSEMIGKPGNSQKIGGIQTDEYSISIDPNNLPVAAFSATVNGASMNFEAVSASSLGKTYIYANDPTKLGLFNILYRNDNNGNGSNDTGFFLFFKQGTLNATQFNITNAIPNNYVRVSTNNITDDDHWLYSLDVNNAPQTLWSAVPALPGINVIFNNLIDKNLYQINSLLNDQVNLVFGDGSFSNIPQGSFRFYYRTSNGLSYTITPDDLASVSVAFNYVSKKNKLETLTVTASLKYTVTNASAAETLADIKSSAPQQYYTQNRMITGEDYNIFPHTTYSSIQKIKAINRTSSGVSLYLDAIDPTGSYSSTNIFGDDGILTANSEIKSTTFNFLTTNDIYSAIYNNIIPLIGSSEMQNYYYANYPRYNQSQTVSSGHFVPGTVYKIATIGSTDFTLLGAPNNNVGTVFTANATGNVSANALVSGKQYTITSVGSTNFIPVGASVNNVGTFFTAVSYTTGTGTAVQGTGTATSALTFMQANVSTSSSSGFLQTAGVTQQIGSGIAGNLQYVMPGAILKFVNDSKNYYGVVTSIIDHGQITNPNLITFGTIIPNGAILSDEFNIGDKSIIPTYKNVLNNSLVSTIASQVLAKLNFGLTYNQITQVWENILPSAIGTSTNWLLKFTYNKGSYTVQYRTIDYIFGSTMSTKFYFDPTTRVYSSLTGSTVNDTIKVLSINPQPNSGMPLVNDVIWQIYNVITQSDGYVDDTQVLVKFPSTQMINVPDNPDLYKLVAGTAANRSNLYFQYKHNVPSRSRIDPTPVNIIDLYVLTASYTNNYINWLRDLTGTVTAPIAPTSSSLETDYGQLDGYKAVSDTIIYNPAKFKPLFGAKADPLLQAKFQVVKNPAVGLTDNEIKTQVINAINLYFDPNNWDFGDTFYFSELAAYLHAKLAPNIASIVVVPASNSQVFGNYFQINALPWEIITNAATVNDIDIVSAVTASQLNINGVNFAGQ